VVIGLLIGSFYPEIAVDAYSPFLSPQFANG
jgi:hypothetical protein